MSRQHIHLPANISERIADGVTSFLGSWWCVGLHTAWFVLWFAFRQSIDLLTLIVSLEAIFLSTFVMMSQSRSGKRDKLRDDLEAQEVDELFTINKEQKEILEQQTTILNQQSEILEALHHV